jgi:hypothetical protein
LVKSGEVTTENAMLYSTNPVELKNLLARA